MLSPYQIYLIFPILGCAFGAMLWLSYLNKLDFLEHERPIDICFAFLIGFLLPSLVLWVYYYLEMFNFHFNGKLINDFLYSIIGIGLTEEVIKLTGVIFVFKLLKKRINEPIDYLIFAGVVALGFSVRENFIYYNNYGSQIITGRTLITCLTHMINTSICVYGLYRYKIFHKGHVFTNSAIAIILAVLSHGLFDFFLTQPIIGTLTPFLATIIYLIGINFWIQMINNAINYSPYFNYEKIGSMSKLYVTILLWYAAILILEFFYAFYYRDFSFAINDVFKNIFREGILILIVTLRISRLKINKRKYVTVKLQSPIYYTQNKDEDINLFGILPLKIRGENAEEFQFIKYMGKHILICPVNENKSVIKHPRKARLLKKYFLKNDVVTYLVEIYSKDENQKEIYLIKPKTTGDTTINGVYPVAILMHYENPAWFQKEHESLSYKDLKSIEQVYLKNK